MRVRGLVVSLVIGCLAMVVVPATAGAWSPATQLQCSRIHNTNGTTTPFTCMGLASATPGYVGWKAEVNDGAADFAYTTTGCGRAVCKAQEAWRLGTDGKWQQTQLFTQTMVYHHPFATGWSWVWTASSGWLAMRSASIAVAPPYSWAVANMSFLHCSRSDMSLPGSTTPPAQYEKCTFERR